MGFNLQGNRPKSPWTVKPGGDDAPVVMATDREDAVGQILFALRLKTLPRGMEVFPVPEEGHGHKAKAKKSKSETSAD